MTVQGEVETTYEASLDLDLASVLERAVGGLDGLALADEPERRSLDATYFDTADLRLAQAGITLRRRTGGDDAGWHLKIPHRADEKVEKHVPLSAARHRVPAPLRRLMRARTLDDDLVPVARIRTERAAHAITDAEAAPVAEVADDRVEGSRLSGDEVEAVMVWREVEIELADGTSVQLLDLDRSVRAHGLVPSQGAARSKLLRVLGDAVRTPPDGPSSRNATAAQVILHHLREQVEQLRGFDPLVRLDRPDSVHRMRVATRRLRSALKTFGPLLDSEQVEPLRVDLAWLAGHLGPARDAEVMRGRMEQIAQDEGPNTAAGRLASSCSRKMERRYREQHREALLALDSDRYHRLVCDLVALTISPPLTSLTERPCSEVLPSLVKNAYRTLQEAVTACVAEPGSGTSEEVQEGATALHEARKKAKRVRYAAEALAPVYGARARELAQALEQVQADLGEHQDSVVLRDWLSRWAQGTTPRNAFILGRWYAAEEERSREAESRFSLSWEAARKDRLRHWLR